MDLVRHMHAQVAEDLAASPPKMVLLAGPRQCGKTTLARALVAERRGAYFSWDIERDRRALKAQLLPLDAPLWAFDELHKLRTWRGWLKGVFDEHGARHSMLVTGSAKLDVYSRGGDSLQGRYFLHRMHPVTVSELLGRPLPSTPEAALERLGEAPDGAAQDAVRLLLERGGFPEPLLASSARFAARWRLGYAARLVREEVRDLERIADLDKVELLAERLPDTVGSVLSLNALREDLEVAHGTVTHWVEVLERLYAVFRVPPFGTSRIKAVKKAPKLYLWDVGRVVAPAARLENLVLLHLLRLVQWMEDAFGERAELRYVRDVAGHEVDALVLRRGQPWLAVEVKTRSAGLDPGLRYFLERVRVPLAFQVGLENTVDRRLPDVNGAIVRELPVARFLAALP